MAPAVRAARSVAHREHGGSSMTASRPIILIGFDAMDPGIARRMAAEGRLPTLARLLGEGAWTTVTNPPGLVVGSTWPSFWTGLWPSRHGFYCFRQLDPRSYKVRRYTPRDITNPSFWTTMAEAGRRVCVVDVPLVPLTQPSNGRHVIDWGTHDRMLDFVAWPDTLDHEIRSTLGEYPLKGRCDDYAERQDWSGLLDVLLQGIARKTDLNIRMLSRGPWDAFLSVYAESHCAGHQFWWAHDPSHKDYDASLGDPMLKVYEALDAALGRLLPHVPAEATLLVLLSHGIGSHHDGDHLLADVLARLDAAYGPTSSALVWREKFVRLFMRTQQRLRGKDTSRLAADPRWVDASRRFIRVPNNELFGGIRINLAGREPRGRVKPSERAALTEWLERELLALTDPDTGRRIVARVLRASELYAGNLIDGLPDLLVDWDRTAPITVVGSSTMGVIRREPVGVRTGDHRPTGLIVGRSADIAAGPMRTPINMVDIAPTVATLAGVRLPDIDGTPIPAFLTKEAVVSA